MRTFELHRDSDASGISGTGVVAEGIEFGDGAVVLRWVAGTHRSTVCWDSIADVVAIHGHGGATRVVWTTHHGLSLDSGDMHPWLPGCTLLEGHGGRCRVAVLVGPRNPHPGVRR